jgi:hypothetical protein
MAVEAEEFASAIWQVSAEIRRLNGWYRVWMAGSNWPARA